MVEEVVVRTGHKIAVGDRFLELRDKGARVEFVDTITEARHGSGVIAVSFGASVQEANNDGFVDVSCRLRMHLGTAQMLHKLLGDMISDALKPVDKSQAN